MTSHQDSRTPTPEDKFSFGLWTVGWQARDPFGGRHPRRRWTRATRCEKLAELGAYGVNFHDDDLIPFGATTRPASEIIARFKQGARRHRPGRPDGRPPTSSPTRSSRTAASPPTTATCAASRCAR